MIPVATEEDKQLPDIQAPGRAMLIQHNPACALKLNSPQMGFIPCMPSDKGATFLGAWDPSPDSQWESAAPVALKHWAAAMTALYPFKIHPSEENEGNTAPGRISFPSCMAVPSPEHWLDIMKVVAVELCVPAWSTSSWKSQDLSTPGPEESSFTTGSQYSVLFQQQSQASETFQVNGRMLKDSPSLNLGDSQIASVCMECCWKGTMDLADTRRYSPANNVCC